MTIRDTLASRSRSPISRLRGPGDSELVRRVMERSSGGKGVSYDPITEADILSDHWAGAGVTEAGTGVSSWLSWGGPTVTYAQGTDADRPSYEATGLGGKPAITADRAAGDLLKTTDIVSTSQSYTLIAAVDQKADLTIQQYLWDNNVGLLAATSLLPGAEIGHYDGTAKGSGTAATTGPQIITWVFESGVGAEYLRGSTSIGTNTYTAKSLTGTTALFGLSTNPANSPCGVALGRVMLFETVDAARDARVRGWMSAHYGIAL